MKFARAALFATAALSTIAAVAPAHAGEEVLYGAAPQWVVPATIDLAEAKDGPAAVLYDWQYRLEDGVVQSYTDTAMRVENPQAMMQAGTLAFDWLPDNGDITIHKLEILRGDEVVDLLAQGVKFDVLRREQALEQRMIDGQLTATLAVPGLRVDDILRVSYSTTDDERALGDEVQAFQYLPSDPWQVGYSRVIASWPSDAEMYYAAEERVELPALVERDGYKFLELELPLAQRDPVPNDAPYRYRRPDVLRIGSFADWEEVSRVMAPHFTAAAQVPDGSPVARQADAIMARTRDPLERAVLATRLVQDEVAYLFEGLDGGGYMPQSAADTWEMRYGDCKAKSVLLMSLLQRMGIDAEVVLVDTEGGDAVPELLPLPAFNHMIVHAVIDGADYWIDGTSTGTRMSNIGNVLPFYHALPLRAGGTGLMAMVQRQPAEPQNVTTITLDQSAGVDFPQLFEYRLETFGPGSAQWRAYADSKDRDVLRQVAQSFAQGGISGASVSNVEISYDEDLARSTLVVRGVAPGLFEWNGEELVAKLGAANSAPKFNPDRARPSWRTIPVATPGPVLGVLNNSVILPDDGKGYTLSGASEFSGGFGNYSVLRQAGIDDDTLRIESQTYLALGEIPADGLRDARLAARRMQTDAVNLKSPADLTWRWDLDAKERQAKAAPILAAYDAAIAFADPDNFGPLQSRASFLASIFEREDALADFDVLVEETPSVWALINRSALLESLGRVDEAIVDRQAAYDLDPQNGIGFDLARKLAYAGRIEEANALLDAMPVGDDDRLSYADVLATVTALSGDVQGGYDVLATEVLDKPNNEQVLNLDCWYRGLFEVELASALDQCTRAVERASNSAAALDSRALVRFRLGQYAQAVQDLDAALAVAPGLAPSMYLRGVVRLTNGDGAGQRDIATALRMSPELADFYARHGIVPPQA